MLRCIYCDYTPEFGSEYADVQPGHFKMHLIPTGDYLCTECYEQSEEAIFELNLEDDEDGA